MPPPAFTLTPCSLADWLAHGPAYVRLYPDRAPDRGYVVVDCADRRAAPNTDGERFWQCGGDAPHSLPEPLYANLTDGQPAGSVRFYPGAGAAALALDRAAWVWALAQPAPAPAPTVTESTLTDWLEHGPTIRRTVGQTPGWTLRLVGSVAGRGVSHPGRYWYGVDAVSGFTGDRVPDQIWARLVGGQTYPDVNNVRYYPTAEEAEAALAAAAIAWADARNAVTPTPPPPEPEPAKPPEPPAPKKSRPAVFVLPQDAAGKFAASLGLTPAEFLARLHAAGGDSYHAKEGGTAAVVREAQPAGAAAAAREDVAAEAFFARVARTVKLPDPGPPVGPADSDVLGTVPSGYRIVVLSSAAVADLNARGKAISLADVRRASAAWFRAADPSRAAEGTDYVDTPNVVGPATPRTREQVVAAVRKYLDLPPAPEPVAPRTQQPARYAPGPRVILLSEAALKDLAAKNGTLSVEDVRRAADGWFRGGKAAPAFDPNDLYNVAKCPSDEGPAVTGDEMLARIRAYVGLPEAPPPPTPQPEPAPETFTEADKGGVRLAVIDATTLDRLTNAYAEKRPIAADQVLKACKAWYYFGNSARPGVFRRGEGAAGLPSWDAVFAEVRGFVNAPAAEPKPEPSTGVDGPQVILLSAEGARMLAARGGTLSMQTLRLSADGWLAGRPATPGVVDVLKSRTSGKTQMTGDEVLAHVGAHLGVPQPAPEPEPTPEPTSGGEVTGPAKNDCRVVLLDDEAIARIQKAERTGTLSCATFHDAAVAWWMCSTKYNPASTRLSQIGRRAAGEAHYAGGYAVDVLEQVAKHLGVDPRVAFAPEKPAAPEPQPEPVKAEVPPPEPTSGGTPEPVMEGCRVVVLDAAGVNELKRKSGTLHYDDFRHNARAWWFHENAKFDPATATGFDQMGSSRSDIPQVGSQTTKDVLAGVARCLNVDPVALFTPPAPPAPEPAPEPKVFGRGESPKDGPHVKRAGVVLIHPDGVAQLTAEFGPHFLDRLSGVAQYYVPTRWTADTPVWERSGYPDRSPSRSGRHALTDAQFMETLRAHLSLPPLSAAPQPPAPEPVTAEVPAAPPYEPKLGDRDDSRARRGDFDKRPHLALVHADGIARIKTELGKDAWYTVERALRTYCPTTHGDTRVWDTNANGSLSNAEFVAALEAHLAFPAGTWLKPEAVKAEVPVVTPKPTLTPGCSYTWVRHDTEWRVEFLTTTVEDPTKALVRYGADTHVVPVAALKPVV